MNRKDLLNVFRNLGFQPHQAEFAKNFFEGDTRRYALEAPPGTGKGFALAGMCGYAVESGAANRILVLCPPALVAQWCQVINQLYRDVHVKSVSSQDLRLMEAMSDDAEFAWPSRTVFVVSVDLAKRFRRTFAVGDWDVIVLDEAHQLRPQTMRTNFVETLMNECESARVIFLSCISPFDQVDEQLGNENRFAVEERILWNRQDLRNWEGDSLAPAPPQFVWVDYIRTSEEIEVVQRLQNYLSKIVADYPKTRLVALSLIKAASSSLYALEQRLHSLIYRRNELIHGVSRAKQQRIFDDVPDVEEQLDFDFLSADANLDQSLALAEMAKKLMVRLDDVGVESKLQALMDLLNERIASSEDGVVIATSFVNTADYLQSAIEEHFPDTDLITGAVSEEDRHRIISEFPAEKRVLITTNAIAGGIRNVRHVVLYDLPWSPLQLEIWIGQFDRFGNDARPDFCVFKDTSESLAVDRPLERIVEKRLTLPEPDFSSEVIADTDWLK